MTARRKPRFEVCQGDGTHPWWARFRAANGRIVWVTENYTRRRDAVQAIALITGNPVRPHHDTFEVVVSVHVDPDGLLEVREVDER